METIPERETLVDIAAQLGVAHSTVRTWCLEEGLPRHVVRNQRGHKICYLPPDTVLALRRRKEAGRQAENLALARIPAAIAVPDPPIPPIPAQIRTGDPRGRPNVAGLRRAGDALWTLALRILLLTLILALRAASAALWAWIALHTSRSVAQALLAPRGSR